MELLILKSDSTVRWEELVAGGECSLVIIKGEQMNTQNILKLNWNISFEGGTLSLFLWDMVILQTDGYSYISPPHPVSPPVCLCFSYSHGWLSHGNWIFIIYQFYPYHDWLSKVEFSIRQCVSVLENHQYSTHKLCFINAEQEYKWLNSTIFWHLSSLSILYIEPIILFWNILLIGLCVIEHRKLLRCGTNIHFGEIQIYTYKFLSGRSLRHFLGRKIETKLFLGNSISLIKLCFIIWDWNETSKIYL